jgi:ATP-dependent Clp protease ATP-binding subunit ClpC
VLVMTSNVGAQLIRSQGAVGFRPQSDESNYAQMKRLLEQEVEREFRPEFVNRLDEIIVFRPLTREDLQQVVRIEVRRLADRMKGQTIELELADLAFEFLIDKGFSPEFGARPLRRAIERYVEDPLSEEILRGGFTRPCRFVVRPNEAADGLAFARAEPSPEAAAAFAAAAAKAAAASAAAAAKAAAAQSAGKASEKRTGKPAEPEGAKAGG